MALLGRNFPNEFPTRLHVAYPNPKGIINPKNNKFLNIIYKVCIVFDIDPVTRTKDWKHHASKQSISIEGIPNRRYSSQPLNESLLIKCQLSLCITFDQNKYKVSNRKFVKYVIEVAIPTPLYSSSKCLEKSQHQNTCKVVDIAIMII